MSEKFFTASRVYLHELLDAISATHNSQRPKRLEIIKAYVNMGPDHAALLRAFLECVYHDDVVMDLPEGIPPYHENTAPDYDYAGRSLFNFFNERMVTYFVKGQSRYIQNPLKRQTLFVQQLESLYKDDAKVLLMMKDKKIPPTIKNITRALWEDACPGWLPPAAPLPNAPSANAS